ATPHYFQNTKSQEQNAIFPPEQLDFHIKRRNPRLIELGLIHGEVMGDDFESKGRGNCVEMVVHPLRISAGANQRHLGRDNH
ncbi:hypothetical protein HAX54_013213, partial [Datura stramonium]|nr:hypothetical protein [Datura stramonium]